VGLNGVEEGLVGISGCGGGICTTGCIWRNLSERYDLRRCSILACIGQILQNRLQVFRNGWAIGGVLQTRFLAAVPPSADLCGSLGGALAFPFQRGLGLLLQGLFIVLRFAFHVMQETELLFVDVRCSGHLLAILTQPIDPQIAVPGVFPAFKQGFYWGFEVYI